VAAEMALQRAAIDVEAGADLMADHDREGPAPVKVSDLVGDGRRRQQHPAQHRKELHADLTCCCKLLSSCHQSARVARRARSTTSGDDEAMRAMSASTSTPLVGLTSIWLLVASLRNCGSLIVAMKAARRAFLRSAGIAGVEP